jgi:hypothetical protein
VALALDYESSGDYGQALKYFQRARDGSAMSGLAVCRHHDVIKGEGIEGCTYMWCHASNTVT